jgi:hypothetical protein
VTAFLERDGLLAALVSASAAGGRLVSAILRKLGVRTRGDAAVAAIEGGFLDR